ncbi:MAG: hypothetical protein EXR72_10015 [Myxococcales bacterium]|nr:hypothetical protein [Myxococcales bacterium]
MPQTPPGDEKAILPLSRWRAALARAGRGGRHLVDELLSEPDVARFLPTLPVQELYYAIREVGLADAHDLVALASPEQLRGFLDLAAWQREEFDVERAAEWIDALIDAGPEKLAEGVEALDPELIALFLQRQARVYDLTLETPPDEPEGHYFPTPDRFFLLDVIAPGEAGKRIERFLDWLYRADLALARRVVMSAKWELDSELAESAYRFRSGRMADLGFVEFYDALDVYRWLDPASVRIGEGSADPQQGEHSTLPVATRSIGEGGFLGRVLATVGEADEMARIHTALLVLANRVMAADLVEPGDPQAARAALDRTAAYLGMGLEFLGRGDPHLAGQGLRSVAVTRIFRVGLSLTLKLKRAAETLVDHSFVSLVPGRASLLDPPHAGAVAALLHRRPLHGLGPRERPFATLAEIAEVASLLEETSLLGPTLQHGLGIDPARLSEEALPGVHPPIGQITFATIVGTLIANAQLDRPPALVPLHPLDLAPLRVKVIDGGTLRTEVRANITRLLDERLAERRFEPPRAWERWVRAWIDRFESALAPSVVGAPAFDPHQLTGLLVRI